MIKHHSESLFILMKGRGGKKIKIIITTNTLGNVEMKNWQ